MSLESSQGITGSSKNISLLTEVRNREVRKQVRDVLKGSGVHPVAMYFAPLHPILKRLGFGDTNLYRLTLAIKK